MVMSEARPEIYEDVEARQEAGQGPLYRVIIHNDDVTPMDFVVYVLRSIFILAIVRAVQVMYAAHHHGSAYVQTLPKAEAQERVHRAHFAAKLQGFPLRFSLEEE
jgi:ATP-dependent Clp protease adaptor protein ClpS